MLWNAFGMLPNMKFALKHIWTLILVPIFLFVRGDLNLNDVMAINFNGIKNNIKEVKHAALNNEEQVTVVVYIAIENGYDGFTGAGVPIYLYDEKYNEMAKSQVIGKYAAFNVLPSQVKNKTLKAVCKLTNDELEITNLFERNTLVLHR